MQNRDTIAAFGLVEQMGGYNNSHSGCGAQLVESEAQARTCRRIEPRRRLVEEQNARTRQQALGNFHAPLQTSGQSLHAVIETVCHAQRLQRRKQTLLQFRAAQPVKVARTAEVFRDGQLRIERRRLEDNTEMLAHLDSFMHHIVAADARRAGGRGQQSGQNPEERCLAAAVGSEQAEHFAVADGQRHVGQSRARSEVAPQSPGFNCVAHSVTASGAGAGGGYVTTRTSWAGAGPRKIAAA